MVPPLHSQSSPCLLEARHHQLSLLLLVHTCSCSSRLSATTLALVSICLGQVSEIHFNRIRLLTLVLDIGSAGFCQGTLMSTSATGNLQDHSDGGNYKGNQSCFWYIYPSNQNFGTYVVLSASSFNLAVGDYVAVYDGNSTSAPVVANVTGSLVTPYNFYASGVQMLVQFSSDINYSSTGFFMSWSTSAYPYVCSCLHAVSVTII